MLNSTRTAKNKDFFYIKGMRNPAIFAAPTPKGCINRHGYSAYYSGTHFHRFSRRKDLYGQVPTAAIHC